MELSDSRKKCNENSLDEGEAISDAGTRATEESEHVAPDTWDTARGFWNRIPSLWPVSTVY